MPLGVLALRAFACPVDLEPVAAEVGGSADSNREERKRERKILYGKVEARLNKTLVKKLNKTLN